MEQKREIKLKKADLILMACIGAAAVILTVSGLIRVRPGNTVTVSVDGAKLWQGPLSADETMTFSGAEGYTCRVVIEGGSVRVESASCPDKSCVRQGAVSKSGQAIVCLPARIVVEVSGLEEESSYDAVSR